MRPRPKGSLTSPKKVSFHRDNVSVIKPKVPRVCAHCKEQHSISRCSKFSQLATSDRLDFAKQQSLCLNCLSKGHRHKECPSSNRCFVCRYTSHKAPSREQASQGDYELNACPQRTSQHRGLRTLCVCKRPTHCAYANSTGNSGVQFQKVHVQSAT